MVTSVVPRVLPRCTTPLLWSLSLSLPLSLMYFNSPKGYHGCKKSSNIKIDTRLVHRCQGHLLHICCVPRDQAMGQRAPGTESNTSSNSTLQCRLESRICLEEGLWRGAKSGTKEFIEFYKVATPVSIEFGSRSELNKPFMHFCFMLKGLLLFLKHRPLRANWWRMTLSYLSMALFIGWPFYHTKHLPPLALYISQLYLF